MLVPTIVTPGERNVLIIPLQPQFSLNWIVSGPDDYTFDARNEASVYPALPRVRRGKHSAAELLDEERGLAVNL
jgi:hypothetical protein